MGISDDIKPKRSRHSEHSRHSDYIFDDFDDIEEEKEEKHHEPAPQPHHHDDYESREDLENEFFSNQKHKKRSDYEEEDEDEEKPEHPAKHKHKSNRFAKVLIWLMILGFAGLIAWQNKSEIMSLIREKIFSEKAGTSPVESQSTSDDYYSGEPSNSNSGATSNLNSNAGALSAPAATTALTDKTGIKIEILNGNGIKNSGAKLKSDLESAGYTIAKTANAKNFNYATTLIYYKTGKEAEANSIKSAITGREITIENNDTLAGTYDVVIVIGAK